MQRNEELEPQCADAGFSNPAPTHHLKDSFTTPLGHVVIHGMDSSALKSRTRDKTPYSKVSRQGGGWEGTVDDCSGDDDAGSHIGTPHAPLNLKHSKH